MKGDVVDGLGVALLMQHLLTHLQIPQSPRVVEASGSEKAPGWMERQAGNTMGCVTFDICQWLFVV